MGIVHRPLAASLLLSTFAGVSAAPTVDLYGDFLPSGAVARLGGMRLRHAGVIQVITYSPDGKTLISASDSIRVWDATSGRLVGEMAGSPGSMIHSLSISSDGRALARTGERDGTVLVLELATGRELIRLKGHKNFTTSVAFSPDCKVLATGGTDGTIRFWNLASGKELHKLDNPGTTTYLAYTPGGSGIVSTTWTQSGKGECRLWDLGTEKVVRRWADVGKPTILSPDGKMLATGTTDPRLRLWEVDTGKELRQFELPGENLTTPAEAARCAAFSPDGNLLAAGDVTNRVHVWHMSTGKELYVSPPFQNDVMCLAFSPDCKSLAVGAWHRILLWEAATGKDLLPLGGHADQVSRVVFSPDSKTVASQSEDALILSDPLTGRERQKWSDKNLKAFSPGGDLVLREKGSVVHWQPATAKTIRTFMVYERELADDVAWITVLFSRDGKWMVTGSNDRTIRLWNFETGKELWRAKRENKGVRFPADIGDHVPLGFSHDGKAVISVGHDTLVRFWDAETGMELRWFAIGSYRAALSYDGRFLVAVGKQEVAPDGKSEKKSGAPPRLWDLQTGQEPQPVQLHAKDARAMAFSPDGSVVALAVEADIILVERVSGKVVRHLKGHQDQVIDLAFSHDGRLLVSGSYDLTGLVWDVTGLMRDRRFPQLRLTPEELEAAWADLADADGAKAHRAIWKLVAAPGQAVPLLASRLKPIPPVEPVRLDKLVGDLNHTAFAAREKAMKELENLAELVEPALRAALDKKPSAEVRSRLETLLARPNWPVTDPERLRALRSVAVLGQVGDADCQRIVDALAKGAPEARLTQEAKASQQRLANHAAKPR